MDVADHLFVHFVLGGDEHHGHGVVDQRDGTVLHFSGGVALRVDVADFLQLQRALKGDGKLVSAPEVEGVVGRREFLGDVLNGSITVQHLFHQAGDVVQSRHQAHERLVFQLTQPSTHVHGQDGEDGHLGSECFGGRHANFRSGVGVRPGMGLAGDA